MSLQQERITALCEQLKFARLYAEWPALAQDEARTEAGLMSRSARDARRC